MRISRPRKLVVKFNLRRSILANKAFNKPMTLSPELAAICKAKKLSRGEVMSAVWAYIKKHKLQDPDDKRTIKPDAKLAEVLGKKPINMFKMTKALQAHFS